MNNKPSIVSVDSIEDVAKNLSEHIATAISNGKRVLWLISGGSSVPVAVLASSYLKQVDTSRLTTAIVDEKFIEGSVHVSNGEELIEKGFNAGNATVLQILKPSIDRDLLRDMYEKDITEALEGADYVIGQFGIGEGYHTGGIVAHSPALSTKDLTADYTLANERHITVTATLIRKIDLVVVNSMGESKRALVNHFLESEASIDDEPTQLLKQAVSTILYSDVVPTEQ